MTLSTPDSDQRAFRETSLGPRTAIICILSVGLMVLDHQNDHLSMVRSWLATAAYPVRVLIDAPSSIGHWLGDTLATRTMLVRENDELNDRILIQSGRLQRLDALETENARLRALLDSTAKIDDRMLIAEVMSVDMNPFRHKIVVNRGSHDGVYVGQALIDADGVIGQVISTQQWSAEALLITDIDHALPVEIVRNRLRTIAVGTGDLEQLSLPFLPRNADVIEGDLLVTSGLGGVFPPGYPVGTVAEIRSARGEPFLSIVATPAARLNRIREILLIWPQAPDGSTTNSVAARPGEPGETQRPPAGTPGGAAPESAPTGTTPAGPPNPATEAGSVTSDAPEEAAATAPPPAPGAETD